MLEALYNNTGDLEPVPLSKTLLWHRRLLVNLLWKFFEQPFLRKTSEWLLILIVLSEPDVLVALTLIFKTLSIENMNFLEAKVKTVLRSPIVKCWSPSF